MHLYENVKIFFKGVEILISCTNVTFEKYEEILQYDPENMLEILEINDNRKSKHQVTINQKKK